MSVIHDLVAKSLRAIKATPHEEYEKALLNAFEQHPPVQQSNWFGRHYFNLAHDRAWFANSLIENARMEGYGSAQIWKFSNRLTNPEYIAKVRQHSLDESRHAMIFVMMLNVVFPRALEDDELRVAVESLYPGFTPRNPPPNEEVPPELIVDGEAAIDELIQVHLTEIRALVLQHLLRSAIVAHAPTESQNTIRKFMGSLIRDESKHIEYTAGLFEDFIQAGHRDFVFAKLAQHQAALNDLTYEELERDKIGG